MTEERLEQLEELARRAVRQAVAAGADAAEALVAEGAELEATVRLGKPEVVHEASSMALGLRVFRDHRSAVTYTSDLGPALDGFVDDTVALAALAEPDELNELPEAELLAGALPDLDLWDERTSAIDAATAIASAVEGERAALGFSPKVTNSEGATFGRSLGGRALASLDRRGVDFSGSYRGTYQSLAVAPICDDRDGKKRNGHHWTGARFLAALEPAEAVGREAARRAVAQIGAEKMDTGTLPVVFDADAARALLGTLFGVVSGGAIYRRSSYLVGREGSEVASSLVTIVDDPLLPRAPGARPFDGEGLPSRRNVVVERGVLRTFLLDTYSARKLGRRSNGCAGRSVGGAPHVSTSNLVLLAGETPEEELLRGVSRGLYVTGMMGFGFNPVTGDFSRGAHGFEIVDGSLGRPVSEVTVSANFDDLWRSIDAVGARLDLRSSTASPAFRVRQMTVAGR